MADLRELLEPFAASINAKATALRKLELDGQQKQRFLESISDDIKKCTNFVMPRASVAAVQAAKEINPPLDLLTLGWHDQHKYDPGRQIFHLEHMDPVSAIRDTIVAEVNEFGISESRIVEILVSRINVVWILKTEDKELTDRGYQVNRPEPEAAYRDARIEILEIDTT